MAWNIPLKIKLKKDNQNMKNIALYKWQMNCWYTSKLFSAHFKSPSNSAKLQYMSFKHDQLKKGHFIYKEFGTEDYES